MKISMDKHFYLLPGIGNEIKHQSIYLWDFPPIVFIGNEDNLPFSLLC